MSYVVNVDVSSKQLEGIQATLGEGLADFVTAAERLKVAGDEVKGQLNVTAEIKSIKDSLSAMSGAIERATTAEVVKIAIAMSEVGTALHNVATAIDSVRVGDRMQTAVDAFIHKFVGAMEAASQHIPTTSAGGTAAATPKASIIPPTFIAETIDITGRVDKAIKTTNFQVDKINLTSRIDDVIAAKHFNLAKIDLTDRVNFNIHSGIFTTKNIDLTERIQLAVNSMKVGVENEIKVKRTSAPTEANHNPAPVSFVASQFTFEPVTLSASQFRFEPVNLANEQFKFNKIAIDSKQFTFNPVSLDANQFTIEPIVLSENKFTFEPIVISQDKIKLETEAPVPVAAPKVDVAKVEINEITLPASKFKFSTIAIPPEQIKLAEIKVKGSQIAFSEVAVNGNQFTFTPIEVGGSQLSFAQITLAADQFKFNPIQIEGQQLSFEPVVINNEQITFTPISTTAKDLNFEPIVITSSDLVFEPIVIAADRISLQPIEISADKFTFDPIKIAASQIEFDRVTLDPKQFEFDKIQLSAADIVSRISIDSINIRDLVADAVASGGGVNLHDIVANEIAAGSREKESTTANNIDTVVTTADAGLEAIIKLFEDFRATSETELHAARDQYAELEAARKKIGDVNKSFLNLGTAINSTISLFDGIVASIAKIAGRFEELAQRVHSGQTTPEAGVAEAETLGKDELLIGRIKNESTQYKRDINGEKYDNFKKLLVSSGAPEEEGQLQADNLKSEDIKAHARVLKAQANQIANTADISAEAVAEYAKALLFFTKGAADASTELKEEIKQILQLNKSGADKLFTNPDKKLKINTKDFSTSGDINKIPNIVSVLNQEQETGEYQTPTDANGMASADDVSSLGRLGFRGSKDLKHILKNAYKKANDGTRSAAEIIDEFERLTSEPEQQSKLDGKDKAILADKIAQERSKIATNGVKLDNQTSNLISFVKSAYASLGHTIEEVTNDFRTGADKVSEVAAAVAKPVVKTAKVVKASAEYFQEIQDAKAAAREAAKPIDVKATEVVDDAMPTRPTPPALLKKPAQPPAQPPAEPPVTPPTAAAEPPPEEEKDNYRTEVGIGRNRFKHGVRQDLERAEAAASNPENQRVAEFQETDFINFRKEQYLGLLKYNLKLVAGKDAEAAKQAMAEIANLEAGLGDEAIDTQVEFRKLVDDAAAKRRRPVTKEAQYNQASGAPVDLNSIDPEEGGVKDLTRLKIIENNLKKRLGDLLAGEHSIAGIEAAHQQFINDNFDDVAKIDPSKLDEIKKRRTGKVTTANKQAAGEAAKDSKAIFDQAMFEYREAIADGLAGNLGAAADAAVNILDPKQKQQAVLAVMKERNKERDLAQSQPKKAEDEEREAFDREHSILKSKFGRKQEIDTSSLVPKTAKQQEQLDALNQRINDRIEQSLEDRHVAILKAYLGKLRVANADARTNNIITPVATPVIDPKYFTPGVEVAQKGYQKSQTDAMNRIHKANATELRDQGTYEALEQLEAGFAERLYGYASAMRQLRKELDRKNSGETPFDVEIKRLRDEVKQTGAMPSLEALSNSIDLNAPQEIQDVLVARLQAIGKELREKVAQMGETKFNKRLSDVKLKTKDNDNQLDASDLTELNTLAISDTAKTKVSLFEKDVQKALDSSVKSLVDEERKAVLATLRNDGAKAASAALQTIESKYGNAIPQQLRDARRTIDEAFQKSILDNVKRQIALAQSEFDATNKDKRKVNVSELAKAGVGTDYSRLTPDNQLLAESMISNGQQRLTTLTKQHDNKEFTDAKAAAKYDGNLEPLRAIESYQVSTRAKEAGAELKKMLADLAKMSAEERQHIAEVRAQMNAARSDETDGKVGLINEAIAAARSKVSPRPNQPGQPANTNSEVYTNSLKYIENQGLKALKDKSASEHDADKPTSIQDLAGYYYTFKSVAVTIAESLHKLSEAAIATTKAMMLLEVANNNSASRTQKDVEAAEGLSRDFGGASNDYKALIGKFKAGTPIEYDKQGEKVPSKLDDAQVVSIVRNLQSASVVNHLDSQEVGQLNLAVQEILSKNQVQSKELVRQLGNVIPGAVPKFAQAQGMSTKELRNAMEMGNVGLDAFVRFTDKLGETYGEQAKKGTLIKELNTFRGNTQQISETAAGSIAPVAQLGLSAVNATLEGVKANTATLAFVALPATITAIYSLGKVLASTFLNNPLSEKFLGGAKEKLIQNAIPVGAAVAGLTISSVGAKVLGEQSLDNVFANLPVKIGQSIGLTIDKIFGTRPEFRPDDKELGKAKTEYSSIIGGSLVGLSGLQFLRANFNKGLDYNANLPMPSVNLGGVRAVGANAGELASNLGSRIGEKVGKVVELGKAVAGNPFGAIVLAESKFNSITANVGTKLNKFADLAKTAIDNPLVTMVLAENKMRQTSAKIGESFGNLTTNMSGKVTGAVSKVTGAFGELTEKLGSLNTSGSFLAKMGLGRNTAERPLTAEEHQAKASLGNIAGDLSVSLVTTVAAIAIANTTFVSDYSTAIEDLVKKIRAVNFGLNPNGKTATTNDLLAGEQAGKFNADVPTKILRDTFASATGNFKGMTVEGLTNIVNTPTPFGTIDFFNSKEKAAAEIKRRQEGGTQEGGFGRTNLENAQTNSILSANQIMEDTDRTVAKAMDNSLYVEDYKKADAAKAKLQKLRDADLAAQYASQKNGTVIDPAEQEKRESAILNATNEYNTAATPLNKRRPAIVEAIKTANAEIDAAKSDPIGNFGSMPAAAKIIAAAEKRKTGYEQNLADIEKNVSDFYDSVSALTKATHKFQQLNKIIERRGNIQATSDLTASAQSAKQRLSEGDELLAGDRKATIAVNTAKNNLTNSEEKAKLADEYVQTINSKPPGEEQAKELQAAMDAQIEAHKAVATNLGVLNQSLVDKQNQREQGLITAYDNDQNKLNTQTNRYVNKVRTSYAPSLDTRAQPNIEAAIADQTDNAAVIKAKESYTHWLKNDKAMVVNRTAYLQRLLQLRAEAEIAEENLGFNRKTRDRDRTQRNETNMFQDLDRGFTRLDTASSERRQDRTPQAVVFSETQFKRDTASSGVSQAKDDLAVADQKIKAIAVALANIKSPQLKIEKDLEYAKMLADFKKKQFDVETAIINQLRQKYEEVRSTIEQMGSINNEIASQRSQQKQDIANRQLEDNQFRATGATGEVNTIESLKAKVTEAQTVAAGLQQAINEALVNSESQIQTYRNEMVNKLPDSDPGKVPALNRINKQGAAISDVIDILFKGGKEGKGLMATDLNIFIGQFTNALNKFKLTPGLTDQSVGTLKLKLAGKDVTFSGNQGELATMEKVLENFKAPLAKKNKDTADVTAANHALEVGNRKADEKLRAGAATIEKTKLEGDTTAADYDRKFNDGIEQFKKEAKLVRSKAPDAKNYTDAMKLETELKQELDQRNAGNKTRAAKNKLDLEQIDNEYKAKTATDPKDIAINKQEYEEKRTAKLKQIAAEEMGANEKLIEAMKSQTLSYLAITDGNKSVFKQMSANLLQVQMAGVSLLKSYGVMAGEVNLVSFHKDDQGKYSAQTSKFNADDEAQLASAEAGQKVEAHNDSIDELKKSIESLNTANTPEAFAQVIATAKSYNDPKMTTAAVAIEDALKSGAPFDTAQIKEWIALLNNASSNLVKVSDEKLAEIKQNAADMVNLRKASELATLDAESGQQYIKNRQSAFRHGSVESTGDIRDMDDRTTQIYNAKIDAIRAETELAIKKAGGVDTFDGQLAVRRGQNKESEIQNEYSDLPLYGKQFSSDIADAVSSAAKFSTVMREAIEKGSWGEAFSSMMRNLLNKLADTYSDRAAKQIGDMVRGSIDSIFGLNNPLTGSGGSGGINPMQLLGGLGDRQDNNDYGGIFSKLFAGLNRPLGNGGMGSGSLIGNLSNDGNWLNSLFGGTENLFGFSQGSIPSLSMGSLPSYADGKPGTAYPKTPTQDTREPYQSHLAVINSNELVLSAAQVQGYQNYKNEIATNSIMTNNNNSRSTVNNYRNTNISMSNADTFGFSDYSIKQGNKSRFDKK